MNKKREAIAWLTTLLISLITSVVMVQVATRLAFASTDKLDLAVASVRRSSADYGPDDSQPLLASLKRELISEADHENELLRRANAERSNLVLPGIGANNLLAALLATPTTLPTQLITAAPSPTLPPTQTSAVANTPRSSPSLAPPITVTNTWTATVTSLPTRSPGPTLISAATQLATFTSAVTANPTLTTTQTITASVTSEISTKTATATLATTSLNATAITSVTNTKSATATATIPNTPTQTTTATATWTATATLRPIPTGGLRINFQPPGVAVPAGYLPDFGEPFGQQGDGYLFGWNTVNKNTFDRDLVTDQRYDTVTFMQTEGDFKWELAVSNGRYTVLIVAGDACCTDSKYRLNVEDKLVVKGQATDSDHWIKGQAVVEVKDGRLTVSNAPSAENNKINFIEIYPGEVSITAEPTLTGVPTLTRTPSPPLQPSATLKPTTVNSDQLLTGTPNSAGP